MMRHMVQTTIVDLQTKVLPAEDAGGWGTMRNGGANFAVSRLRVEEAATDPWPGSKRFQNPPRKLDTTLLENPARHIHLISPNAPHPRNIVKRGVMK